MIKDEAPELGRLNSIEPEAEVDALNEMPASFITTTLRSSRNAFNVELELDPNPIPTLKLESVVRGSGGRGGASRTSSQ